MVRDVVDKTREVLQNEIADLKQEVSYLKALLADKGIEYEEFKLPTKTVSVPALTNENQGDLIKHEKITENHAKFFYSMFKTRRDWYSLRGKKPNEKSGTTPYYPQCANFWKVGLCRDQFGKKRKCKGCPNKVNKPLTGDVILAHLRGVREDCGDVVGVYPLFPDETCNFLVFDFDNHNAEDNVVDFANTNDEWINEVNALREICRINGVDVLVERSRSGKGAHLWIFFESPIVAKAARRFGTALLTKGAESVNQKNFKTYDRMIPTQDHLPEGGLGNLIALPLQGQALKAGNSAFIDENWNAYPDQWKRLQNVKKLKSDFVEEKIKEWTTDGILGALSDDLSGESVDKKEAIASKEKPWDKGAIKFANEDVEGILQFTVADQIYIESANLKNRIQNQIRRLASFGNPIFYKKQAMGFSTIGESRIISCSQDIDGYIAIPRGCKEKLVEKLKVAGIPYKEDLRCQRGKPIKVDFVGELYPEQKKAVEKLLSYENGVLAATTGFGKTVVGSFLISERKVNTLILVDGSEIMKNWLEDFEKFLAIDEELPEYQTPTGRVKKRKSVIGKMYAGHNSITGIIDVVSISSLWKRGEINELVKNYGMVIMDECHHAPAKTNYDVLTKVNAKHLYGFTATPKRDDGQGQKIFMLFGPIRYRYTAKDRVKERGMNHYIFPRFTRMVHINGDNLKVTEAYKEMIHNESRNSQIVNDVIQCVEDGRTPLVLSKQVEHAKLLYERLENKANHVFLLVGGRTSKKRDEVREAIKAVPEDETIVIVATGQYIGEGFNYPRLDTMMLTMPISWEGNVEQYAGRLHRDFEDKRDVIVYDYVDSHIKVLARMFKKRLTTYRKIGYHLVNSLSDEKQETNSIFDSDSYLEVYEQDLLEARKEILIVSPGINHKKVKKLIGIVQKPQTNGVDIAIVTLQPEVYPDERIEATKLLIGEMKAAGFKVREMALLQDYFAVIDQEIVWYGSMNLLSREKKDDNLMRVVSKEIAHELLEIIVTKSKNVENG